MYKITETISLIHSFRIT